MVRVITVLVIH